jgi:hypothetical protein
LGGIRTELTILLTFLAAAATVSAADLLHDRGFSLSVGGEYQLISQEYYQVDYDTVTVDLIETWQLDRDEIDDYIFKTDLGYKYRTDHNRFDLWTDLEVSGKRFLGRGDIVYRFGNNGHNAKMSMSVESKAPYGDEESRLEGYNHLLGYLRTDHKIGRKFGVNAKVGYDWISFAEKVESATTGDTDFVSNTIFPYYDYAIFSGSVGGVFLFSEFGHDLTWQAVYRNRQVPDSSLADYDSYRFELNYNNIGLNGYATLTGYIEAKDYTRPGDEDDYSAVELTGIASRSLGEKWEGAAYFWIDAYWYDRIDVVHRNYGLFRGELKSSYRLNGVGLGPLARLEYRSEGSSTDASTDYFSDAYTQWEIGAHADMLDIRRLFFMAELALGYRNYAAESDILTSYRVVSPSLVATYSLSKRLSLTVLFDGVFERHERVEDNSTLYLLTVGLSARF